MDAGALGTRLGRGTGGTRGAGGGPPTAGQAGWGGSTGLGGGGGRGAGGGWRRGPVEGQGAGAGGVGGAPARSAEAATAENVLEGLLELLAEAGVYYGVDTAVEVTQPEGDLKDGVRRSVVWEDRAWIHTYTHIHTHTHAVTPLLGHPKSFKAKYIDLCVPGCA